MQYGLTVALWRIGVHPNVLLTHHSMTIQIASMSSDNHGNKKRMSQQMDKGQNHSAAVEDLPLLLDKSSHLRRVMYELTD